MQRLESTLERIDRKGYGAYKDLRGSYGFEDFDLFIDKVQRDPFAPPSLIRVRTKDNRFVPALFGKPSVAIVARARADRSRYSALHRSFSPAPRWS